MSVIPGEQGPCPQGAGKGQLVSDLGSVWEESSSGGARGPGNRDVPRDAEAR